jgi:hypothetical protein
MTASFLGSSTYNCGGSLIASQEKLFSSLSLNHFLAFTKRKSLSTSHFLKGTMSRDFFLQVFFHESSSPKPLKIALGSFEIAGAWGN